MLKEMAVESEPTNEESSAGVIEECVLWTRLGESGPPDSTTQIFCMLTVQLENLGLQVSVECCRRPSCCCQMILSVSHCLILATTSLGGYSNKQVG